MSELKCGLKNCPYKVTIDWISLKADDRKKIVDFMEFLLSQKKHQDKPAPQQAVEGERDNRCVCGTGRGAVWCEIHQCFTGGLVPPP